MSAPDRRTRWRAAVYAHPVATASTKLVCLLLLDSGMKANGVVSVPRSRLAEALGVDPSRITEAVNAAVELGLLARVANGYPGHTAVLQALIPKGAENSTCKGAESVPLQPGEDGSEGCGFHPPNTRARLRTSTAPDTGPQRHSRRRGPGPNPNPAGTRKTENPEGVSHARARHLSAVPTTSPSSSRQQLVDAPPARQRPPKAEDVVVDLCARCHLSPCVRTHPRGTSSSSRLAVVPVPDGTCSSCGWPLGSEGHHTNCLRGTG